MKENENNTTPITPGLSDAALEARRAYHRKYQQERKEQAKERARRYWERKAAKISGNEPPEKESPKQAHNTRPRKAKPAEPLAAIWQKGFPPQKGWYAVQLRFLGETLAAPRILWWTADMWAIAPDGARSIGQSYRVIRWFPLPDLEG